MIIIISGKDKFYCGIRIVWSPITESYDHCEIKFHWPFHSITTSTLTHWFFTIYFSEQQNNYTAMDDNNLNEKQKLKHGLTETNLERGVDNSIGTSGNIVAVNDNIKHIYYWCSQFRRESNKCTHKKTLWADQYGFYQLNEFLGRKCPKQIKLESINTIGSKQIGNLLTWRNVATKETISAIKKWNDKYDADCHRHITRLFFNLNYFICSLIIH